MSTMQVPFNDLSRYTSTLWAAAQPQLEQAISGGRVMMGAGLAGFEDAFASFLGGGELIGVANGTDALEIALRAVGTTAGSSVLLAANAGCYASTAVRAIGAKLGYVDIADREVTPGAAEIAAALEANRDVTAVVVTHLFGKIAADLAAIVELCAAAGVALVEDCAQIHGARVNGRAAGTFGDAASFSFYPTKNLGALGDGGAVFTRSAEVANKVRLLRQYGWTQKYVVDVAGARNSRLDELQAIVLRAGLDDLDTRNERRRAIVRRYVAAAPDLDFVCVGRDDEDWVGHLAVVSVSDRTDVRGQLAARGVATDVHFPVADHLQPVNGTAAAVSLPNTEREAERVLSLPAFPDMTDDEVEHVATALTELRR